MRLIGVSFIIAQNLCKQIKKQRRKEQKKRKEKERKKKEKTCDVSIFFKINLINAETYGFMPIRRTHTMFHNFFTIISFI